MISFESYILKQQYQKVAALGDAGDVNWHPFRKIVSGIYDNTSPKGGRPNTDPVLMIKLLLLQAWYGLSDQELEYQSTNRIDFMRFLGFPDKAPDYSTVWRFRERLAKTGKDREIWDELQRQLDARGHLIVIRDQLRNKRISKRRMPVERHYAAIKTHYGSSHVHVTTLARTRVKNTFACFGFNLDQLATLRRHGAA